MLHMPYTKPPICSSQFADEQSAALVVTRIGHWSICELVETHCGPGATQSHSDCIATRPFGEMAGAAVWCAGPGANLGAVGSAYAQAGIFLSGSGELCKRWVRADRYWSVANMPIPSLYLLINFVVCAFDFHLPDSSADYLHLS